MRTLASTSPSTAKTLTTIDFFHAGENLPLVNSTRLTTIFVTRD
jgi:hypothetical protein